MGPFDGVLLPPSRMTIRQFEEGFQCTALQLHFLSLNQPMAGYLSGWPSRAIVIVPLVPTPARKQTHHEIGVRAQPASTCWLLLLMSWLFGG